MSAEGSIKIGDKIGRILETNGKSQQVWRARSSRSLDARAVLDKALDTTE